MSHNSGIPYDPAAFGSSNNGAMRSESRLVMFDLGVKRNSEHDVGACMCASHRVNSCVADNFQAVMLGEVAASAQALASHEQALASHELKFAYCSSCSCRNTSSVVVSGMQKSTACLHYHALPVCCLENGLA